MIKPIIYTILLSSFLVACGGSSSDTDPEDGQNVVDDGSSNDDSNNDDTPQDGSNGDNSNGSNQDSWGSVAGERNTAELVFPDPHAFFTGIKRSKAEIAAGSLSLHPRGDVELFIKTFQSVEKISDKEGFKRWQTKIYGDVVYTMEYSATSDKKHWKFYVDGTDNSGYENDYWLLYEHVEKANGDSHWEYYDKKLETKSIKTQLTMSKVGSRVDILEYSLLIPNEGSLKSETAILYSTPTTGRMVQYDDVPNDHQDHYIYTFDDATDYWWVDCSGDLETVDPATACNTVTSGFLNQ